METETSPTSSSPNMSDWSPSSWRSLDALQQPEWPDAAALNEVTKRLGGLPPLVFAGEARQLREHLAEVAMGRAFLLQAGDCAESFSDFSADAIRDKLQIILQMAVVLTYTSGVPVVKIGRIAGQFAKPRSSATETVDQIELPSFRGHMVNDENFDGPSRVADPARLLTAYHQSASTLNLLRSFTKGGFADLTRVQEWNQQFISDRPQGLRYAEVAVGIERTLAFMRACGIVTNETPGLSTVDLYTSHEALILDYEEALTRVDSLTGDWYDCSAHMLWIGERTRNLDGAHVDFLRGVQNPIGCKLGPTATGAEVIELCERLNPDNEPGRLTLIVRMGADKIEEGFEPLLRDVNDAGHRVAWVCDPMHGNTYTSPSGHKTRHLDSITAEVQGFFATHQEVGTWPGGIHCELTGGDVTECVGGTTEISEDDLKVRYETMCDPRLNASQSLDLAFRIGELLQS